jgi:hypothetical protein
MSYMVFKGKQCPGILDDGKLQVSPENRVHAKTEGKTSPVGLVVMDKPVKDDEAAMDFEHQDKAVNMDPFVFLQSPSQTLWRKLIENL